MATAVNMKQSVCMKPCTAMRRPTVLTRAAASQTHNASRRVVEGPNVITISTTYRSTTQPLLGPKSLEAYMAYMGQDISRIARFPLGAELILTPGTSNFKMVVPKMSVFDVWVLPIAYTTISQSPGVVSMEATDCEITGSSHVEQLKLNDLFNIKALVAFKASGTVATPTVTSEATFSLNIDVPPPFSFLPKPLLEGTGNAALSPIVSVLMNSFITSLVEDHKKWSNV